MKRVLTRRTLLRGAGVALGLPWLEASTGPHAKAPVRLAALYMPNGTREDIWTPEKTGRDFQLTPMLAPLKGLERELLILTNLWNANSKGGDGHYVKVSGWLTSTTITKTLGVDVSCNGISLDQLAAQKAGRVTPIPSLELGVAPVTTGVDKNVGYTRVYGSHIAWGGPTSPLAREIDPHLVYERLFRAHQPASANAAKADTQLLDRVLEEATSLRKQLGAPIATAWTSTSPSCAPSNNASSAPIVPKAARWKARAPLTEASKPPASPKDFADTSA